MTALPPMRKTCIRHGRRSARATEISWASPLAFAKRDKYEQLASELDEKIAAALKEKDDAVLARWEREKRELTYNYLNQWEVRPNMAEMLYRMMPSFTPLTSGSYSFLNSSCDDLTEMFLKGRLDARTYAARLDERMWMAKMEGSH